MKKLILLSATITMVCYSHAQEVPSLATLKSEYNGNINTLDFLNSIMSKFNPPAFTGSEKDIEDAIKQWYKEDPTLFLTIEPTNNGEWNTIADKFAIDIRTNELLPKKLVPVGGLYRKSTILQVLKQLGLQTLSDQEVNEIAQLEAEKAITRANARANRPPIDLSSESQVTERVLAPMIDLID